MRGDNYLVRVTHTANAPPDVKLHTQIASKPKLQTREHFLDPAADPPQLIFSLIYVINCNLNESRENYVEVNNKNKMHLAKLNFVQT